MSNGEDVLDSWEEIDEADLFKTLQQPFQAENTQQQENILRNNLNTFSSSTFTVAKNTNCVQETTSSKSEEFRPMKLLMRPPTGATAVDAVAVGSNASNELNALDTMSDTFKPVIMMLNNTNDEYQSVNYTAPIANQTVKILRRPTQQSEAERRNGMAKPKQPIKSLQQREQEYAEARLRIMGAAKNPEDDLANTDKLKKPTGLNATVPSSAKPITSETATISNNIKEKQETEKLLQQYAMMVDGAGSVSVSVPAFGNNVHANLCKTNFIPQHQTAQNYCYPNATNCATDMYGNRPPVNMLAMPSQQTLLTTQNYPHLNTGLYQLQQQNRQFQKQYSFPNPNQSMQQQKSWPALTGSGGNGNGNGGGGTGGNVGFANSNSHAKLLQQSQHNKIFHLKNNNSNNKNLNQQNNTTQNESILRLPRGPDGSHGFQVRR